MCVLCVCVLCVGEWVVRDIMEKLRRKQKVKKHYVYTSVCILYIHVCR